MDILRVLKERSKQADTRPSELPLFSPAQVSAEKQQELLYQESCCAHKPEESHEKTAADLSPRVVRLTCLPPNSLDHRDVVITVLENPSGSWAAGNGSTLWDSAIALSGYLLKHQLRWLQGKRGLELGAGNILHIMLFIYTAISILTS